MLSSLATLEPLISGLDVSLFLTTTNQKQKAISYVVRSNIIISRKHMFPFQIVIVFGLQYEMELYFCCCYF